MFKAIRQPLTMLSITAGLFVGNLILGFGFTHSLIKAAVAMAVMQCLGYLIEYGMYKIDKVMTKKTGGN